MKTDLFTKQRERQEAKLGLTNEDKNAVRQQLEADIEEFLANGGTITEVATELTKLERKRARQQQKKQKLSEKEVDRRLQEFARTGKVTLQ